MANVNELAESIDALNTLNLENLRNELSIIEQDQIDRSQQRILFD